MRRIALALLLMLCPAVAHAHKPSDSYLILSQQGDRISGQWDIALRDLDFAIGLDADGDGKITWGEVKAKHAEIAAYAFARLSASVDGAECPISVVDNLIDNHSDGAYAVLKFIVKCPRAPENLLVTYRLFFDIDPQHRGLLRLESGGETRAAVFAPGAEQQSFTLGRVDRFRQFLDYFVTGVLHIWGGYDHMLFLLSLLIPAVTVVGANERESPKSFRAVCTDLLAIVTAFTISHAIALTFATLQIVTPPARLTESAIALTVVLAALNNFYPLVRDRRWALGFIFGFIHGFGFASVLADLGLSGGALVLALLGFNLGVEAGQISVGAVFLPFAYILRGTWFYRRVVSIAGSAAIVVIATLWFIERAFDLRFLPVH